MYRKKAKRLTFSDSGLAPNRTAAVRYHIETWVATLICCEECPKAHQMRRYMPGSMCATRPRFHSSVGIRITAPEAMVKIAMMQAVSAPKVTSGIDPS